MADIISYVLDPKGSVYSDILYQKHTDPTVDKEDVIEQVLANDKDLSEGEKVKLRQKLRETKTPADNLREMIYAAASPDGSPKVAESAIDIEPYLQQRWKINADEAMQLNKLILEKTKEHKDVKAAIKTTLQEMYEEGFDASALRVYGQYMIDVGNMLIKPVKSQVVANTYNEYKKYASEIKPEERQELQKQYEILTAPQYGEAMAPEWPKLEVAGVNVGEFDSAYRYMRKNPKFDVDEAAVNYIRYQYPEYDKLPEEKKKRIAKTAKEAALMAVKQNIVDYSMPRPSEVVEKANGDLKVAREMYKEQAIKIASLAGKDSAYMDRLLKITDDYFDVVEEVRKKSPGISAITYGLLGIPLGQPRERLKR